MAIAPTLFTYLEKRLQGVLVAGFPVVVYTLMLVSGMLLTLRARLINLAIYALLVVFHVDMYFSMQAVKQPSSILDRDAPGFGTQCS